MKKEQDTVEEIVKNHFPDGNNYNYVSYNGNSENKLNNVCLDGGFDLQSLIDDLFTLLYTTLNSTLQRIQEKVVDRELHPEATGGTSVYRENDIAFNSANAIIRQVINEEMK